MGKNLAKNGKISLLRVKDCQTKALYAERFKRHPACKRETNMNGLCHAEILLHANQICGMSLADSTNLQITVHHKIWHCTYLA